MSLYILRCRRAAEEGNNLLWTLEVIKYTYLQYKYVDVHS